MFELRIYQPSWDKKEEYQNKHQIRLDLRRLGIRARVVRAHENCNKIIFNNQQDMNLYKISGKILLRNSGIMYEWIR